MFLHESLIQLSDGPDKDFSSITRVDVDPLTDQFIPQRIEGLKIDPVHLKGSSYLKGFIFFAEAGHSTSYEYD